MHATVRPHALLAGGGTGGHVFPALAVGEELALRGWEVSLVGRAGSLEQRLAESRGVSFHALAARPLVGRGAVARVASILTLGRSTLAARRLVRRLGARVVFATGGYVCAPTALGARLARRPVMLLEPNARAGMANRWLSRVVSEAAVAYPGTTADLACPTVHTGVPVRSEFFRVADERPADGGPTRLLVLGGSQGSEQLNRLLPAALAELESAVPGHGGLEVHHQAGAEHAAATAARYDTLARAGARLAVEVTPFLDDVAAAMAAAHLVVSRAGAVTLAEICAAGRASLLVPLALAGGHQADNARALVAAGAAEMVEAGEVEASAFARRLSRLLGDRRRLAAMGRGARNLARAGASAAIADRLEKLGGGA